MPTDVQFKDELRKEDYLSLIENNEIDKLKKKFYDNIERIEASLQD